MADMLIRGLDEEVLQALNAKAQALGKDRLSFVRELLIQVASEPMVRETYAYRLYGENGIATIRRLSSDLNGVSGGAKNLNEQEFAAYKRAQDMMRRNAPGDQQEAIYILRQAFRDVMEIPV